MPKAKLLYPKNQGFIDKTAPYPVHPVEIWTNVYVQASEMHRSLSVMGVLQALVILGVFGGIVGWVGVRSAQAGLGALRAGGVSILGGVGLIAVGGVCTGLLYALVRLATRSVTAPSSEAVVKLSEDLVTHGQLTTGRVIEVRAMERSGKEKILTYGYRDDQQRDVTRIFKTESRVDVGKGDAVVVMYWGGFSGLL